MLSKDELSDNHKLTPTALEESLAEKDVPSADLPNNATATGTNALLLSMVSL